MKTLIFSLLIVFMVGCYYEDVPEYKECNPGSMMCENNKAMLCESDSLWWTSQDCSAIGETCVYNNPALQSGFTGLATCENI